MLPIPWTSQVSHLDENVAAAALELTPEQGLDTRFEGLPRVNAVKGTWQGDHTFVIDVLGLGLGQPPEQWTLAFFGEKVNVLVKLPEGSEAL